MRSVAEKALLIIQNPTQMGHLLTDAARDLSKANTSLSGIHFTLCTFSLEHLSVQGKLLLYSRSSVPYSLSSLS